MSTRQLRQLERCDNGVERAGLAVGGEADNRPAPQEAELMLGIGVVRPDRSRLRREEGVELACPGRDREHLEVAYEDALEGLDVTGIQPASGPRAGLVQDAAEGQMTDRRV